MIVLTRKKMMILAVTYTISSTFISIQLIKTSWMKNWSSSSLLQELAVEQEQKLLFTSLRRRRKTSIMDEVPVMGLHDNTVEEDDMMRKLEAKAIRLLYRNQREGLGHALPPKTHYAFTTFQLSLGQSTSFTYNLTNYQNDTLEWNGDISSYEGRVVCEMNKLHSLNMNHIPHFAQVAFPCWSVLHQFASAKRYIKLNRIQLKKLTSKWIIDLMETFQDAGITFLDHGTSEVGPKGIEETVWTVSIDKQNNGGFPRELEDLKFSVENSKYFLNSHLDVQALQRHVLATNFTQGSQRRHRMPLRALLIDRAGSTREWIYSNETASQIKQEWGDDIHVKVISTLNGTLHEQAMEMHNADIIISPHGAQLTNLAFICPCTAVLELFPRNYYLGYFQPLVLSAGGIAFDGYPWDRSRLVDTSAEFISDKKTRQWLRKSPIYASPESILRVLPNVISHILSCRRGE